MKDVKKFGKLAQYKLYMKMLKEDAIVDGQDDKTLDEIHNIEEPEVNKGEPGLFTSDNEDIMAIHNKLMHQFVPSQLIYDNKGNLQ